MENKIYVIKELREITNTGLKEAIEMVNKYEDGALEDKSLVEKAINHVKQCSFSGKILKPIESVRKAIRDRLTSIENVVKDLISNCDDDFDNVDTDSLDRILNDALTIKDRLVSRLEDAISDESES